MRENTRRNGKLATIGIVAALAVAACVPATQEEVAMGNDYAQQVERGLNAWASHSNEHSINCATSCETR